MNGTKWPVETGKELQVEHVSDDYCLPIYQQDIKESASTQKVLTLDDLFKKTSFQPPLYYIPAKDQ